MAWCRQATSDYLDQCWPRHMHSSPCHKESISSSMVRYEAQDNPSWRLLITRINQPNTNLCEQLMPRHVCFNFLKIWLIKCYHLDHDFYKIGVNTLTYNNVNDSPTYDNVNVIVICPRLLSYLRTSLPFPLSMPYSTCPVALHIPTNIPAAIAWISNHLTHIFSDVITYTCPRYPH